MQLLVRTLLLLSFTQTNITIHQGAQATHQAAETIFNGNERMFPWFPIKTNIIKLLIRVFAGKSARNRPECSNIVG